MSKEDPVKFFAFNGAKEPISIDDFATLASLPLVMLLRARDPNHNYEYGFGENTKDFLTYDINRMPHSRLLRILKKRLATVQFRSPEVVSREGGANYRIAVYDRKNWNLSDGEALNRVEAGWDAVMKVVPTKYDLE